MAAEEPTHSRTRGYPLGGARAPRIDVTIRISGFFRDAFPNLVHLMDEAIEMVARLEEPDDRNFVAAHFRSEVEHRRLAGEEPEVAENQALHRIFGSKPGSYGAGILPLLDERNWQTDADIAEVYATWGGYAYTRTVYGLRAPETFKLRLGQVSVAVKNQDNREHDIFDSDDYLQFTVA